MFGIALAVLIKMNENYIKFIKVMFWNSNHFYIWIVGVVDLKFRL